MPGRLTTVIKGTFIGATETELGKADKALLKQWLKDNEDMQLDHKGMALKYEVLTEPMTKHTDEFFENGPGAFFPDLDVKTKKDVVRGAAIQALRLSLYESFVDGVPGPEREEPKPIVGYWFAGGPAFEAYVCDSLHEVHMILVTPDPLPVLKPPPAQHSRDEAMWLVASPGRAEAIRERAPDYDYEDPEPMPAGLAAVCQRVKSY